MRFLLDTHTFLWFDAGSARLNPHVRTLIESPEHERFVSIATLWEMAIKASLGRLDLRLSLIEYAEVAVEGNGFRLLAVTPPHLERISAMPFHHRNPFDRMLVAQALADDFTLLSRDETLDAYGIRRLW